MVDDGPILHPFSVFESVENGLLFETVCETVVPHAGKKY